MQKLEELEEIFSMSKQQGISGGGARQLIQSRDQTLGIYRIPPYTYIHVLDTNTNVTRIINGPLTYTRQDHERVVYGPAAMINIPPRRYVVVGNPAQRAENGDVEKDKFGQVKLLHGEREIRTHESWQDPFSLFPGETASKVKELLVVEKNQSLTLKATRDFDEIQSDGAAIKRYAGDEWQFRGPGTYIPRVEVDEKGIESAIVVHHNQALKLKAKRACVDHKGVARRAGEEWLVRDSGAYLLSVDEELEDTLTSAVLTEKTAIHLRATKTFTDVYGISRKAGDEWLVTIGMAEQHITDVYEEVEDCCIELTMLNNRQYCVVVDPYINGVQKLATKQLRQGETHFFLQPGETLENGICDIHVLRDDEALLLQASEAFTDDSPGKASVVRRPGDRWMVYGPCEYIPPVEAEICDVRKAIPLDENEGIYVRDTSSGHVRAVIGETYMLKPTEELWSKRLTDEVESLLKKQALGSVYIAPSYYGGKKQKKPPMKQQMAAVKLPPPASGRDPTRVVQFRVPHNAAVQVYDFKKKSSRVVFGPELICLLPDEQFTILRLSGDKPKRPNVIKSLCLMLGPDFMTDIIEVETSDHARLRLTLAYNWHFDVDKSDPENPAASSVFNVRDFTGDACKALASRVRGCVASETFDNFHKHSAKIIRGSVFGLKEGKVGDCLKFDANNLVITNVDIQTVEPVDVSTRESLQKSVKLAIEITTSSQEARARHNAHAEEEAAKGRLERQQLINQAQAEEQKSTLLKLQAESAAIESSGQATAEARARSEAAAIEGKARVKQAELEAEASKIESDARMAQLIQTQNAEIAHQQKLNDLEIQKAQKLAEIEANKFKATVDAIGADTIAAMARAGPEMQAKLLQGLGLKGYLVTDGKSPINLFNTAQGMIGGGQQGAANQ